ncbi:unnamed protein product, partial [Effrenium voratum]
MAMPPLPKRARAVPARCRWASTHPRWRAVTRANGRRKRTRAPAGCGIRPP